MSDSQVPELTLMPKVPLSPTLAADAMVAQLRDQGRDIFHMGFGQAPFPAPNRLIKAVQDHAHEKAYLPVAGLAELQREIGKHQSRLLGTDAASFDVLTAPGSKLIIYAVQMAVAGDLILPTPSWVSYAPQAAMLGQNVIPVATALNERGYIINADVLEKTIVQAKSEGKNPTKILLNYPSNPTGLTIPDDALQDIADVCIQQNMCIIADEIYGRLAFDGAYRSISTYAPNHTVVTTGLSKHLSLGGWRMGVGTVPKTIPGLFEALCGIASETWSCVAAPIQIAAIEAYAGHDDIESFIADSTAIHHTVTRFVVSELREMGIPCMNAQGGFYVWPDFKEPLQNASNQHVKTSDALAHQLLQQEGIVTLPGTAFGEQRTALKLRLSTCDYNGAEALRYFENKNKSLSAEDIEHFAPRIAGAMAGIKRFLNA